MALRKQYIPTLIRFDEAGVMTPVFLKPDDRWRRIDQIYEVRRMPFLTGGSGVRYTIRVGREIGHIMYDLFTDPLQWFVEVEGEEPKDGAQ